MNKLLKIKRGMRGDTIIEVLLSMTVLAIVSGAAYVTSTRSFHASINSQDRDQAVSLAQQQLEILKNADSPQGTIDTYKAQTNAFCIKSDATVQVSATGCSASTINTNGDSNFTVTDTYDSTSQRFRVTISWKSADNQNSQTVVYYKPSNSYVPSCPTGTPVGSCAGCPTGSDSCSFTAPTHNVTTNPPSAGITVTVNGSSGSSGTIVSAYGQTVRVTWSTSNVKTGTCVASSSPASAGWNGSKADSSGSGSGDTTAALTGDTTFTLTCTALDNTTSTGTASVHVPQPPPPAATTNAATAVTYSSATLNGTVNPNGYAATYIFKYGTSSSYGSTTAVTSAGSGSSNVPAAASIGVSASTTYHFQVCATSMFGTSCGSDTTFMSSPFPTPSISYFYASPGTVNYGSGSTLYWSSTNTTSCTWGGASGAVGTGALYGNTGYTLTCSGPGGSVQAYTVVYVNPPPPPPPPPCSASAGGWRSGNNVWITGGGSGCGYYRDSVVGWNGGGTWGPYGSPGTFCHTQMGGTDPWGWLSSQGWCG